MTKCKCKCNSQTLLEKKWRRLIKGSEVAKQCHQGGWLRIGMEWFPLHDLHRTGYHSKQQEVHQGEPAAARHGSGTEEMLFGLSHHFRLSYKWVMTLCRVSHTEHMEKIQTGLRWPNTPPRSGHLIKWNNPEWRSLARQVTKNTTVNIGVFSCHEEFLGWDGRTLRKDNYQCRTAPIRPVW